MKIPTHPELVTALLKPGQDIIDSMTIERADALHNAVGISGEAGEICEAIIHALANPLDRENIVEEIGDLHFYIEGLFQNYSILGRPEFEYRQIQSPHTSFELMMNTVALNAAAGSLLDTVKKEVIYNKPRNGGAVKDALFALCDALIKFTRSANAYGVSHADKFVVIEYEEVVEANIAKLMTRYESLSYSDEQANARADKLPHGEVPAPLPDPAPEREVEEAVIAKLRSRGDEGHRKYGTTMDRKDLTIREWITHLQEELLDGAQYAERLLRGNDLLDDAQKLMTSVVEGGSITREEATAWCIEHTNQFGDLSK